MIRSRLKQLRACWTMLAAIPIPQSSQTPKADDLAQAPIVGIGIAIPACVIILLANALEILNGNELLVAALAFASIIILAGALHEDGIADLADALGAKTNHPENRFQIMRDSHIGTFGVLALLISCGIRVTALAALLAQDPLSAVAALLAAVALSRAAITLLAAATPLAQDAGDNGLAAKLGQPQPQAATEASLIAIAVTLILLNLADALITLLAAAAALAAIRRLILNQLRGYNGDALGASQQVVEVAVLACLALASE